MYTETKTKFLKCDYFIKMYCKQDNTICISLFDTFLPGSGHNEQKPVNLMNNKSWRF